MEWYKPHETQFDWITINTTVMSEEHSNMRESKLTIKMTDLKMQMPLMRAGSEMRTRKKDFFLLFSNIETK